MDGRMDSSCNPRTYAFCSFVIVPTDQEWSVASSFTREKLACLVEVSVTEQTLWKFPEIWENWACTNSVYQAIFSTPMHESTRACKWGYPKPWQKWEVGMVQNPPKSCFREEKEVTSETACMIIRETCCTPDDHHASVLCSWRNCSML